MDPKAIGHGRVLVRACAHARMHNDSLPVTCAAAAASICCSQLSWSPPPCRSLSRVSRAARAAAAAASAAAGSRGGWRLWPVVCRGQCAVVWPWVVGTSSHVPACAPSSNTKAGLFLRSPGRGAPAAAAP